MHIVQKLTILIIPIFIFFLSSCKKEDKVQYVISENDFIPLFVKQNDFIATTIKGIDGLGERQWAFNTSTLSYGDEITLIFNTYEDTISCYQREGLSFYNLPSEKGRYVILPYQKYVYNPSNPYYYMQYNRLLSDGDVIEATWDIVEDSPSFIEILELDEVAKTMSGTFEVFLLRVDTFASRPVYSDRINFRNGTFKVAY